MTLPRGEADADALLTGVPFLEGLGVEKRLVEGVIVRRK